MVSQVLRVIVAMVANLVSTDVMGKIINLKLHAMFYQLDFSYNGAPGAAGPRVNFSLKNTDIFLHRIGIL